MTTEILADPGTGSPIWAAERHLMAQRINDTLAALGATVPAVRVQALGVRDELGATGSVEAATVVHVYGHHALIGPFGDGRACANCLTRRWQGVRGATLREGLELGGQVGAVGENPYTHTFAADFIAGVIARHVGHDDPAVNEVILVDLQRLTVYRHHLVADVDCPSCGLPELDTAEGARPTLGPSPKRSPLSFRLRPIDEYPLDLDAYANPVCGVVGTAVVQDLLSVSTASTVGCFSTRTGEYLRETYWGGHADNYADSGRIGVLEGLERYAGMRAKAKTTSVFGSLEQFTAAGIPRVDPQVCGLYSEEFHRRKPEVTRFRPDREISWVWGYSLRDDHPILVPEILTYYSTPGLQNRFVQESSNGCASGGSVVEAAYFGLMEVVERDAFMLMWFGRAALPEIDPTTSARAHTRSMVDRLAMYGYRARFFDTRMTFGVPVITGVAVRADGRMGTLCFGAGAGLDPEAALEAAMCEIATDAVKLQERTERDEATLRPMIEDFDQVLALHDHPLIYGFPEMAGHCDFLLAADTPMRSMARTYGSDLPVIRPSSDLTDDLTACVEDLAAKGFEVIIVDQTLPEQAAMGLHTVSVLVPGLLPIDFGWRRQRAPLLPRALTAFRESGRRETDLDASDLNTVPHPFP